MNVNPTNLAAGPNPTADSNQILRLNQRFSGEILQVSGDRVTLAVQGVQIVARMVSTEQTAQLVDRKFANFVVKEATPNNILLQLLPPSPSTTQPNLPAATADLATQILKQMGLEISRENILIINSLIRNGLDLNENLIEKMRQVLSATGSWGEPEANLAASLLKNNIPLSGSTLQLAMRMSGFDFKESILLLQSQLQQLARTHPQLAGDIKQALSFLNSLPVDLYLPVEKLTEQIRSSINNLYSSLENKISELLRSGNFSSIPQEGVFALIKLRQALQTQGMTGLVEKIDHFLDGLRMMQLLNTPEASNKLLDTQLMIKIPLHSEAQADKGDKIITDDLDVAQMRISFRRQSDDASQKSNYHHLTIQVDVEEGKPIEVDLSIVDKKMISSITSPDPVLDQLAQAEFSSFCDQLTQLGYTLLAARFEIDHIQPIAWQPEVSQSTQVVQSINVKA